MYALIGVLVTNQNPPTAKLDDIVFGGEESDELVVVATAHTKKALEKFLTQTDSRVRKMPNGHTIQVHAVATDKGRIHFALWGIRRVLANVSE